MNTAMADGASERLDAQIADALFGRPGMSKMDVANRLRQLRGAGAPLLCGSCYGLGVIGYTSGQTPEQFEQGEYPCPDCAQPSQAGQGGALELADQLRAIVESQHSTSQNAADDTGYLPSDVIDTLNRAAAALAARQTVGKIVGWQHCADNYAHMVISDSNKSALKQGETQEGIRKIDAAYSIPLVRQSAGISVEWVLGYLTADAPEESREAIRNAFAEYAALSGARQPMREPVCTDCGTPLLYECVGCSKMNYPQHPQAAGLGQFRDPDHLAEWLGSLVDGSEQEEWDAAQAAMIGVRAFQQHPAVIERLREAVEGECDGLAITAEQAAAIFDHVLEPSPLIDSKAVGK